VNATLSVQSLSIRKKDEIELVIAPLKPVDSVAGKVVLERSEGPGKPFTRFGKMAKVSYAGPPIPVLKLRLPATEQSGFYQVRFIGKPSAQKPVQFMATDK
jgi:phospholipase A1